MSELIKVRFISDPNNLNELQSYYWGNQGIVISENQIYDQVDEKLVDRMKIFLGENSKVDTENLKLDYFIGDQEINRTDLVYNEKYQLHFNYVEDYEAKQFKLDFTIYNHEDLRKDAVDENIFIFNEKSMVIKTNNYSKYFKPVPYLESKLVNYDLSTKSDWRKMINFLWISLSMIDYQWLP
ncbi:hypothetical protein SCLARK_00270 [Spiroplasma clarkii]|uniref:hypothetical protein n=1 Tax=Spiroplasma clarkii TaxID=2139 RepID=UPI000B54A065|nr:hypothetical protein [Spiroplasma clarkii]ARU91027.1 hypothetical protein SCLARK_00270 [Spiroplasma clarkii]